MDGSGRVAGCAGGRPLRRIRRAAQVLVLCSGLVLVAIPAVALAQAAGPSSCPAATAGQVSCAALDPGMNNPGWLADHDHTAGSCISPAGTPSPSYCLR